MVEQKEVEYKMIDISPEGSVLDKGRVIRYFQDQKENEGLIVVQTSEFKLHWDTKTITCRFGVKSKYAEETVSKEKFLDLMTTNENLLRDLEAANELVEELKKELSGKLFEECSTEQIRTCAEKFNAIVEQEKKDNPLAEIKTDEPYDDPEDRL